ncbi:22481_t:CDS:2, partial [Entrophospora sp. SA101]
IMPLGGAKQVKTLDELLEISDFVTLHVPETEETKFMFGEKQFNLMNERKKKNNIKGGGSYLINASRGSVVQIPALIKALNEDIILGAAIDVYPREPSSNGKNFNKEMNPWTQELLACKNLIMTPHIGGSTEEAQRMIGIEVATALYKYINHGTSIGAVNFPQINLRAIEAAEKNSIRVLFVHHNVPGVLK